jgi:hypothetical protein
VGRLVGLERGGIVQIIAGSHRVAGAIEAGITWADVFVVKDMDDHRANRIYHAENATQRSAQATALLGSIASAVHALARGHLLGTLPEIRQGSARSAETSDGLFEKDGTIGWKAIASGASLDRDGRSTGPTLADASWRGVGRLAGLPVAEERDQALAAVAAEMERLVEEAAQLARGRLDHAGAPEGDRSAPIADDLLDLHGSISSSSSTRSSTGSRPSSISAHNRIASTSPSSAAATIACAIHSPTVRPSRGSASIRSM